MPFIHVVGREHGISTRSDDGVLDLLQDMGANAANHLPGTIRAAFAVSLRRGLLTAAEAGAGVGECLNLRRKQLAELREHKRKKERHRFNGYNVEFFGAQPAKCGEDY
jgi:hypothetical protein